MVNILMVDIFNINYISF